MRFSLDWIRDHVDLPAALSTENLADRLTGAGLAVEGAEPQEDGDVVLDIDVTTNRPDCMNHRGLARELSVLFGVALRPVSPAAPTASASAADAVEVTIEDDGCARFAAAVVRGVEVGPSPNWVRRRLEAIGVRAINNVVDVTNYLLWTFGQPMHAFDLAKLAGPSLTARGARAGERVVTLDGNERELAAGTLIVADRAGPVALAGVMGGRDSEVTDTTVDVVVEAAHFRPSPVRATARAHGLHTDASHRFERGADPDFCAEAAQLAARMIQELGGGEILKGTVDVQRGHAAEPPVSISHTALERFAGIEISGSEIERIFRGLGFGFEKLDEPEAAGWRVSPPGWRTYDFQNAYPADFYEEVLRTLGFDALPATLPAIGPPDAPESAEHRLRRKVQDHLAAVGFAETIAWAFHDRGRAAAYPSLFADQRAIEIANPLSDRYAVMRRSLLPGLVEAARYNLRRGAASTRLFEVGHVFAPGGTDHSQAMAGAPVTEVETVGMVLGGTIGSPWQGRATVDFFDLKGVLESLATACGTALVARPASLPKVVEGTGAELAMADDRSARIGFVGQLEDDDDPVPLFVAELATGALRPAGARLEVQPPPRLPGIAVDATITHADSVAWQAVAEAIGAADVADLVGFALEDRYQGEGVPAGAVNTTIRFQYHGGDRALTQDEVNARQAALVTDLEKRFAFEA